MHSLKVAISSGRELLQGDQGRLILCRQEVAWVYMSQALTSQHKDRAFDFGQIVCQIRLDDRACMFLCLWLASCGALHDSQAAAVAVQAIACILVQVVV